jgi:hypothetical protein
MRPMQKVRASDRMESDADRALRRHGNRTNSSVRRLPFLRRDLQDRNVRKKRLHPTAFVIDRGSVILSRISRINNNFHNQGR